MCTVKRYAGQDRYEVLINDGYHLAEMVPIVQLIDGEEVRAYLFTGHRIDGYPLLALDIEFPGIKGRTRNADK